MTWRVGFLLSTNLKFTVFVHIQSSISERHHGGRIVVSEKKEIDIGVCELQSEAGILNREVGIRRGSRKPMPITRFPFVYAVACSGSIESCYGCLCQGFEMA